MDLNRECVGAGGRSTGGGVRGGWTRRLAARVGVVLGLAMSAAGASAQCTTSGWVNGPSIPPGGFGTNGVVRSVVSWDPDGAGPLPPVLVVAGAFTQVGGSLAVNNIAIWDGTTWSSPSSGLTGSSPIVYSLAVFNNVLYATGQFTSAGGVGVNNIARWNGSSWSALSTGLTSAGSANGRAMAVYKGQLFVTGKFGTAGGVASAGIATWKG